MKRNKRLDIGAGVFLGRNRDLGGETRSWRMIER